MNGNCETPHCGHRDATHTGGQHQDECTVVHCHCKAFAQTLFARQRPRPMTPVRACQVASALIRQVEENPTVTQVSFITDDQLNALRVLRDATAKLIVHGLRPREENGQLYIPRENP